MNLIENLMQGVNTITEGVEDILVNEDYVFISDQDGRTLCTVYNDDEGRKRLEEYMKEKGLKKDDVKVSVLNTLESEDLEAIFRTHQLR